MNRSGMLLLPHIRGAVVRDIIANHSSTHELGIKENSIITHIHGQAVTANNFDQLIESLQSQDKDQVPLCWQWQGDARCDVLTLEDRYKSTTNRL
jgi:S1-C subfamily serine protease